MNVSDAKMARILMDMIIWYEAHSLWATVRYYYSVLNQLDNVVFQQTAMAATVYF